MALTLSNHLAALRQSAAKPGDAVGGFLEGQRDQLQKLPGAGQGHGGEFVVNAEATKRFRPILEAINRSVPARAGVKAERPGKGRAYYEGGGVGSEGAGPAGSSTSGDDEGVATDTSTDTDAPPGMNMGDPPGDPFGVPPPPPPPPGTVFGPTYSFSPSPTGMVGHQPGMPGFSPAGPPGNTDPSTGFTVGFDVTNPNDPITAALMAQVDIDAVTLGKAALTAMNPFGGTLGKTAKTAAATVASLAGMGVPGLGTPVSAALAAGIGAANATISAVATALGISTAEAAAALGAGHSAAATATTGAGQGGDAEGEWRSGWQPGEPPVALSDYLAWLRRSTTPLRTALERSPAMTPWGTWALPVYHAGGVVKPAAGTRGLREALILAEPGEYVVQREPARKYRRLLDAINADDPTRITTQARTLREALTR